MIFSNVIKITYVLVNEPENFQTTFALEYYLPNRLKCLVQCCAYAFICRLEYGFSTLINVKETVTYIHKFYVLLIRRTWSIIVSLIVIRTLSLFMLIWFIVAYTHYMDSFWSSLIHQSNSILNYFIDVFVSMIYDLTLKIHSGTYFLLFSSL